MPSATYARVDSYFLYLSIKHILFLVFLMKEIWGSRIWQFHLSNDTYNLLSLKYYQLRVKSVN